MTTTSRPYSWVKRIPPALLHKDSIPLVGHPPAFPWEKFSREIAKVFGLSDIRITPASAYEWREAADFSSGIGDRLAILNLSITPLTGNLCWVIAENDVSLLMSLALAQKELPMETLDPNFQQGFYHFLALEILSVFSSIEFDKGLTPHLQKNVDLPTETSLCMDINITIQQKTILGRLILSSELLQSWKERFAQRSRSASILQDLEVTVSLEAGRISLQSSEWTKVALGDFIALDSCSIKSTGAGRIMLTIGGLPCFRGKVKEGNIKILEHPLYHEADMATDDVEDDNVEADDNAEAEDDVEADQDRDFSLFDNEDEMENEEGVENEEDQIEKNEDEMPEAQVEEQEIDQDTEESSSPEDSEMTISEDQETATFAFEDIPLSIVVEVGRLQMTVGKLMELQPGNLLELNIHPENGVDLVVSGKRIAKGELLLMGECLGVRILDING